MTPNVSDGGFRVPRCLTAPRMVSTPAELKPLVRLDVDLGPDVSLGSLDGSDVVLSPDGTRLVYVSQRRLFTRRLDQPKATELVGTEGAYSPSFSPEDNGWHLPRNRAAASRRARLPVGDSWCENPLPTNNGESVARVVKQNARPPHAKSA
jgi:hypothetical protein